MPFTPGQKIVLTDAFPRDPWWVGRVGIVNEVSEETYEVNATFEVREFGQLVAAIGGWFLMDWVREATKEDARQ